MNEFIKCFSRTLIVLAFILVLTIQSLFIDFGIVDFIFMSIIYILGFLMLYANYKLYKLEKLEQIIRELKVWK